MSNESLEQLMEGMGINPDSEQANQIREKCNFLSSVSKSDFEFILNRLKSGTSRLPNNEKTCPNETTPKYRTTKERIELLIYAKAKGYVVKKAPERNTEMLLANVTPYREVKGRFYYTEASINAKIDRARRLDLYRGI